MYDAGDKVRARKYQVDIHQALNLEDRVGTVVEDHRVLRHDRGAPSQFVVRRAAHVDTVDTDAARAGLIKPLQQLEHRALARARWTNQCDGLAGFDLQ